MCKYLLLIIFIIKSKKLLEIFEYEQCLIKINHTNRSTRPAVRATRTESKDYNKNRVANYHKVLKTVRQL